MLARWLRGWDSKVLRPILAAACRLGVPPNAVTLCSLGVVILSGCLLAFGHFRLGAYLLLFGGLLDGLDGEVARFSGKESAFGAFLDSISDHFGDFVVYLGLLLFALDKGLRTESILIFAAFFGSLFGSHLRSRAGMLGLETKNVGMFTRCERVLVLALGLLTGRVTIALWALAVLNNASAVQRGLYVVRSRARLRIAVERVAKQSNDRFDRHPGAGRGPGSSEGFGKTGFRRPPE